MQFRELEKHKAQSPRLAGILAQFERYLGAILERRSKFAYTADHAALDIVPIIVAKALGIDENLALVILKIAEDEGILTHSYYVFCPRTDNFLASFGSLDDLPEFIRCDYEERTTHGIDEYLIELVFGFVPKLAEIDRVALSM